MCISITFVCLDLNIVSKCAPLDNFSAFRLQSQALKSSWTKLHQSQMVLSLHMLKYCSPLGRKPILGKKDAFTLLPLFPLSSFLSVLSLQEGLSLQQLCPSCPEGRCSMRLCSSMYFPLILCQFFVSGFFSCYPGDPATGDMPKRSLRFEEQSLQTVLCSSYSNRYVMLVGVM